MNNHIPDTSKMVDNSWHERGELPPVGGVYLALYNKEYQECEILRHRINADGISVAAVMNVKTFHVFWTADFRPIKSEREKFMTKVESYYPKAANDEQLDALEQLSFALFDAGFRAPK